MVDGLPAGYLMSAHIKMNDTEEQQDGVPETGQELATISP
jgi:hypothetical protein